MPRVLIIGTSHRYQREAPDVSRDVTDEFSEYLRQSIDSNDAAAMAEEMSREALEEHGLSGSIAQDVCARLGIHHLLADPGPEERERLEIRQRNEIAFAGFFGDLTPDEIEARVRHAYDIREAYWIARLEELAVYPVVFICGAHHVNSFQEKLLALNHDVVVLAVNWVPRVGV